MYRAFSSSCYGEKREKLSFGRVFFPVKTWHFWEEGLPFPRSAWSHFLLSACVIRMQKLYNFSLKSGRADWSARDYLLERRMYAAAYRVSSLQLPSVLPTQTPTNNCGQMGDELKVTQVLRNKLKIKCGRVRAKPSTHPLQASGTL